ncbi:LapA family protein [Streptomyces sp. NBC_00557]|uniref:LapA family protein n=1 Tax=Streptomyces sp. NBC_00557 TaxID=2975776 RepID=UPI002E811A08|nr:LapA family protein [Streptomyces sp. NBC_00557]WUC40102.1 LapA family protein [Streptomyces sp. NBC_00557]
MADKHASSPHPRKGFPVTARTVTAALLAVIAVWFIAVNTAKVHIRLWVSTVVAPLWLVLAIALILGAVIGWLVNRRQYKQLRR